MSKKIQQVTLDLELSSPISLPKLMTLGRPTQHRTPHLITVMPRKRDEMGVVVLEISKDNTIFVDNLSTWSITQISPVSNQQNFCLNLCVLWTINLLYLLEPREFVAKFYS